MMEVFPPPSPFSRPVLAKTRLIVRLVDRSTTLEIFVSMLLLGDEKTIEEKERHKSWSLSSLGTELIKIVAVVAVTLGLSLLYQFVSDKNGVVPMQSIYVPTGQRVNITLSDGTNVWLNARTKIVYPAVFDKSVRQVTVDGEAYFDVAKDKKRPFIVETGKCNMEVLGTKFNVEGYSDKDDFEVTLMEGSVRVASRIGLGDTLMLKPDSKACLQKDGRLKVIPVDDYNPYRWKEGLICFRNESFLSIMNDLEKYFGVSIVVENKNVLKYYFTGKFRQADGIDYALRVLQRDIRFKYERDDENQIIYIR